MEGQARPDGGGETTASGPQQSPLEAAKQIAATMCRQPKEAHWLGVRMENFYRAYQRKIKNVTTADVCDYLEGLMRKGQVDWQIKQSLDAIGLLMRYGYQREDLMIPALREAWGLRMNQRVGICVPDVNATASNGVTSVSERLRRVLRVAHYAIKTETHEAERSVGNTCTKPRCNGRWMKRSDARKWRSQPAVIPYDTALQLTCWSWTTTSARWKNFWGKVMSRQR